MNKTADTNPLSGSENSQQRIHIPRSWFSVFPSLMLYFLMCILSIYISRAFPETLLVFDLDMLGRTYRVSMPLFGLFVLLVLARPLAFMYDCHYEIGRHHLRSTTGILSLQKKEIEIPYEDLLAVHVDQGILDRIFQIGSIVAGTAMTDMPDVVMKGVSNPKYYADHLRARIDQNRIDARPQGAKNETRAS